MCQRHCPPRPSQRVTAIAITVQSAMPRLRSVGDRRPGLSQGAGSNSSAHQASPNRAHGTLSPHHQITWSLTAARRAAIRDFTLDDLDLPNRRITIGRHRQRLGELTYRALRAWLGHRRATWPRTQPARPDLWEDRAGIRAVTRSYLTWNLQRHGVSIELIRRDRVLHKALTARADPLHLALVFGLSHTPAGTRTSPAICWLTRPARTQMPQAGS
jgi:hypothetical protein